MLDLILSSLAATYTQAVASAPKTCKILRSLSITDVEPLELPTFIQKNNIPSPCWFDGKDNGYDGWDDILICWHEETATTHKQTLDFIARRFNAKAFKPLRATLMVNGYKRISNSSAKFKGFDTIYNMYTLEDYDSLVEYYSLMFEKKHENFPLF